MAFGLTGTLAQNDTSFFDNRWPENYGFPFGEWIKELVFWFVNNPVTSFLGDVVEWPFTQFFELILSERVGRSSIETIPWLWVIVGAFLIASFVRNTRIGLVCAGMLAVCGFLGAEYWSETSRTIGMILVSVTLCAIVGIPLGVMSGRIDAVWSVVRPTLDAMQVVHPFVFMLPFIFVFGLGNISATMVTMVFALPPIVRLTNLGIRQVPEDVVEAARAYGATEFRVLTDVQMPLARPAIMTGLNQTLLLAFSMLGIAALMGADGLGRLLYRAINNLSLGLAASAGLAFFLLAVALDRISQSEEEDGVSLFTHVREAWTFRKDSEALFEERMERAADLEDETPDEVPTPVEGRERIGLFIGIAGAVAALASIAMTWGENAGRLSSWVRFADENVNGELQGQSFNGIVASGGSFFGVFVVLFGVLGLLAAVRPLIRFPDVFANLLGRAQGALLVAIAGIVAVMWTLNFFGSSLGSLSDIGLGVAALCGGLVLVEMFVVGTDRLGSDGLMISAFGVFFSAAGYLIANPSPFTVNYAHGIGPMIALLAGAAMVVGGVLAVGVAPYGPRRPLPAGVSWSRIVGLVVALLVVIGSVFGVGTVETKTEFGWLYDSRPASVERSADDGPATVVYHGFDADGPGIGWVSLGLSVAALAVGVVAAGAVSTSENVRWRSSVLLMGLGLGIMVITGGFTLSLVRAADAAPSIAGIGAFLTFLAGFVAFASGRAVVAEFRRTMVYREWVNPDAVVTDTVEAGEPELAHA